MKSTVGTNQNKKLAGKFLSTPCTPCTNRNDRALGRPGSAIRKNLPGLDFELRCGEIWTRVSSLAPSLFAFVVLTQTADLQYALTLLFGYA